MAADGTLMTQIELIYADKLTVWVATNYTDIGL